MADTIRIAGATAGLRCDDGIPIGIERIGAQNDLIVSKLHGDFYEQADRDMLFGGANQAAVTTTIALATTYTGLCLSNPAGNTKKFALERVGATLSVAPAGAGLIGLGGGYSAAGIVTHGTPLIPYPMKLSGGVTPTAKIDAGCTLVAGAGLGLLRVIMPMISAFTNAALPGGATPAIVDIDGAIVLYPGAFVFIYTLTVVVGFFAFTWEELPL